MEKDDFYYELGLKLGEAIVIYACRAWAGGPAVDISSTIFSFVNSQLSSVRERRKVERFFNECVEAVADRSAEFIKHDGVHLPDNEKAAAVIAVEATFNSTKLQDLFKSDLDANKLRAKLERIANPIVQEALLSEAGTEFFHILLSEACAYTMEFATTLPTHQSMAFKEILRRQSTILEHLTALLSLIPERDTRDEFLTFYRRQVAKKFDRMELFGVDFSNAAHRYYPLSLAFISLSAARRSRASSGHIAPIAGPLRVERAISEAENVLIVGEAGSGKTTLLRWLAVQACRRSFENQLESWNNYIPFLIPLRYFAERELPALEEFPSAGLRYAFGPAPTPSWTHDLLEQGRGLILIDGVDELPHGRPRERARQWLQALIASYPRCRYIVTSRPTAVPDNWLEAEDFAVYELQSMSPSDVAIFILQWHKAVAKEMADDSEFSRESDDTATSLVRALASDSHLRDLCVNPLLCALVCALNRERRHQLPRSRLAVYQAALHMLLERRDREREVSKPGDLSADEATYLLQDLAAYLVRNGWADVSLARATLQIQRSLKSMDARNRSGDVTTRNLIERSGILREVTVGRVDFIHKAFQELLAAKHVVDNDEIGLLIHKSNDDQWRDVIIFAAAQMTAKQANEFIAGSLSAHRENIAAREKLLLLACLQGIVAMDRKLRRRVESLAATLMPPVDMETAHVLGSFGGWILDLLRIHSRMTSPQAMASIRTASLIGGTEGLEYIARTIENFWVDEMAIEVVRAWGFFDREVYARKIFPAAPITRLRIVDPLALPYLRELSSLEELELVDLDRIDFWALESPSTTVRRLVVSGSGLSNIEGIEKFPDLTHLDIELSRAGTDLAPLLRLERLECLRIVTKDVAMLGLRQLPALVNLRMLQIRQPAGTIVNLAPFANRDLTVVVVRDLGLVARENVNVIEISELPPMV